MEKRLIGLDICDTYTQLCCAGQEQILNFPTVICRKKDTDSWLVGQEAYASALVGDGVIVDKLLKLLRKEGTATIGGVRYEGIELMQKFLECVLARAGSGAETGGTDAGGAGAGEAAAGSVTGADRGPDHGPAGTDGGVEAAGAMDSMSRSDRGPAGASAAGDMGVAGAMEDSVPGPDGGPAGTSAAGGMEAAGAMEDPVPGPDGGSAGTSAAGGMGAAAPEAYREPAGTSAGVGTAGTVPAPAPPAYDSGQIGRLVITVPKISGRLLDLLVSCTDRLRIPRERVHIISHTEAFLYYVLSQKREVWNNQVGMFDLSEDFLCYYEMKVQRGLRQVVVMADREKLDEGFDLDILNTPSGAKLADKILCSCGERFLQRKLFSSVFLTGKGFESQDWAKDFMKMVCTRRKVYTDQALYVQGAAYKAADLERDKTSYPYVFICDGRLDTTVSVKITRRDQEELLVLAAAGDNWYEARSSLEFILDHQQYIEFVITPADPKRRKTVKLTLEGFPERDDKTLRVLVETAFLDENTMSVTVKDMGFGEFYPSTGAVIRQEVML